MLQKLHAYPTLVVALLVSFMAITGAILSIEPAMNQLQSVSTSAPIANVADLANAVAMNFNDPQKLIRKASGSLLVYHYGDIGLQANYVNPVTGSDLGAYESSGFFGFITELHRSMFAGGFGRFATGVAAVAMGVLAGSGVFLLAKQMGGWKNILGPVHGTSGRRLHIHVGRLSFLLLIITAISGAWMSLINFGILSDGAVGFLPYPANVSGGLVAPIPDLVALQNIVVSDLRELTFPIAGDAFDVFSITTASGTGYVDQSTGALLTFTLNNIWHDIYQLVYTLHTGQGIWWFAPILGAGALSIPILAFTGLAMWWRRARGREPRIANNNKAGEADVIILVGSQSNSTWEFAATLHAALVKNDHKVHTISMNSLAKEYPRAQQMFVLTSTYGDGAAPDNANRFLRKLSQMKAVSGLRYAVLGFGDRSFPKFCRFAFDVDAKMQAHRLTRLSQVFAIDRQSAQSFAQWGDDIGQCLNETLILNHVPAIPKTAHYVLAKRTDHGEELQAHKTILRFSLKGVRGDNRRFEAGDLIGILPPGQETPRYYSLASSRQDGFLEICVSKHPGGVCSGFLHGLQPGDAVEGFIRLNPEFHPSKNSKPILMIGAGTGIAPFAGFLRGNTKRRPMYLYWGGRDQTSDYLYQKELALWRKDGRLAGGAVAFSRAKQGKYVQHKLQEDSLFIQSAIANGAQIMVCGGVAMARDVRRAIDGICKPLGTNYEILKQNGRFVEDVY